MQEEVEVSVKIRLKRFGTKKRVYYRLVVIDSRAPRDGKTIEEVGQYRPVENENQVTLDAERIKEWLAKGALPSQTVKKLLNKQNIAVK